MPKNPRDMNDKELARAARRAADKADRAILVRDRLVRDGADDGQIEAAVENVTAVLMEHGDVLHEHSLRGR